MDEDYHMAMQHWKKFLFSKTTAIYYAPDEGNVIDILNQFTTYLVTVARKSDDEYYSLGSVLQFLSGVKKTFEKRMLLGLFGQDRVKKPRWWLRVV